MAVCAVAFLVLASTALITSDDDNQNKKYDRMEVMIPVRDGIKLKTYIFKPEKITEPLPFLMMRTPYSAQGYGVALASKAFAHLTNEGYIFVIQDLRGRFGSEGEFVMMRPPKDKNNPANVDEGTDTNDTISWLLTNIPDNNGRVGVFGISYGGWTTVQAIVAPHPAIKAVSPQASPDDMFIGDDFSHNGAFRLGPSFGYSAMMESGKTNLPFKFDQYDAYEFYLDLGALHNANNKYFQGKIPSWNNFMAHSNYDEYWKGINVTRYLKKLHVPTLNVAGWWDAEDFYGPMKIYGHLEKMDEEKKNFLVVGPWRHGGWAGQDGSKLWDIEFDSNTSEYFKVNVEAPWFAYFLKDKGALDLPEALTFLTGANKWVRYDTWPPSYMTEDTKLYFRSGQSLSFAAPEDTAQEACDSYVSDPAKPVPYTKRPMPGFWQGASAEWKIEDQRFVHLRPDVLSWETEPLEEDVVVSGKIAAHLFASTTGTDSDWIVKLIDVYPEDYKKKKLSGYQLMIADEVLRGKFRNSFEKPEPVEPGALVEYKINLNSRNHCFQKGHKIMIQVQSTWFPLIDRNPQKFIDIPKAKDSDYQKATQKIFRTKEHPTHIVIPVVKK
ncbi:MAG: CocE/NonD family hydrolase [Candidatus Aminicenantes bacterium]|nr:CocE/NonD family hydrolase [Candidatus Aminicenantes bacterium]